jgi:hypothetical protein
VSTATEEQAVLQEHTTRQCAQSIFAIDHE